MYVSTNPPRIVLNIGFLAGQSLWLYESTDPHTDVDATGYFTSVRDLGVKSGDLMIVRKTDTGATTLHSVTAVDANGDATISAAVLE